jgi:2-desacetyl-2-hydroxyethyl bacteriochlorophyllide A dehydrogenase
MTSRETMTGVVYRGPGRVEVRDDLPVPAVTGARDAVVRVGCAGICGTDLHPYRGEIPEFEAGTVLGHEFAGTVVDAGPEVPFRPGQRVFASDLVACGRCRNCGRGWHYHCDQASLFGYSTVVGPPLPGGQAEYVRVPFADVLLWPTPDDLADEQAILVGDILSTAYSAVTDAGLVPGDVVAVVGGGPVGVLAARCALTAGASAVIVAEANPLRRDQAARLGLSAVDPVCFPSAVHEASQARGAQVVIEAVGTDAALAAALSVTARRATVVAVGAHHSPAMPFPAGLAFARELTLRFTVGDPIRVRDQVFPLMRTGRLATADVISHRLPLQSAPAAYQTLHRGEAMKIVLLPQPS